MVTSGRNNSTYFRNHSRIYRPCTQLLLLLTAKCLTTITRDLFSVAVTNMNAETAWCSLSDAAGTCECHSTALQRCDVSRSRGTSCRAGKAQSRCGPNGTSDPVNSPHTCVWTHSWIGSRHPADDAEVGQEIVWTFASLRSDSCVERASYSFPEQLHDLAV